jgi:hypothetical protein
MPARQATKVLMPSEPRNNLPTKTLQRSKAHRRGAHAIKDGDVRPIIDPPNADTDDRVCPTTAVSRDSRNWSIVLGQALDQPLGNTASRPVSARRCPTFGQIYPQAVQARDWCLRARVSRCQYGRRRLAYQTAALKRSKCSARRSRSGRSLSRFGR